MFSLEHGSLLPQIQSPLFPESSLMIRKTLKLGVLARLGGLLLLAPTWAVM